MKDEHKTRQQLINELVELRGCIAELETVEAQYKKIKEALQESEKEYRQFTDFLPQIVFEVDKRGNITFANRKLLEFFGYNQDDLEKGLNIFQMVISEDRDRARDNMQKRLSGEELGGNEYTALRKDGSTFPFVIYATPIIHGNKLVGLRGIAVDITQRKQTEEALRESEKRLRDIFEAASNVSFIMTDLAGIEAHILEFSPGAERIFGYSREEVIGKPVAMLHLLEDVVRFPEVIEAMRQRKEGFTGESTLVRKSGEKFPALFTTYPVFDAKGNMTATLGVSIDITERKRAEEALRQSEEKYRTTFEHTGTAMAIDNEDKTICLVNTEAENLSGYKKEEL